MVGGVGSTLVPMVPQVESGFTPRGDSTLGPPPFRTLSVPASILYELRWGLADDLLRPERRLSLDGGVSGIPSAARGVVGVAPLPEGHMNPRLELRAVCALLSGRPARGRAPLTRNTSKSGRPSASVSGSLKQELLVCEFEKLVEDGARGVRQP